MKRTKIPICTLADLALVMSTYIPTRARQATVHAGGAPGALLWQDRLDLGPRDQAVGVAVEGTRVFVVGAGQSPSSPSLPMDWAWSACWDWVPAQKRSELSRRRPLIEKAMQEGIHYYPDLVNQILTSVG